MTTFDPDAVLRLPIEAATVTVERGRVAFFLRTVGEPVPPGDDPLEVPPTFLFSLLNEVLEPFGDLGSLGLDLGDVLHGEQSFTYRAPVLSGDTVRVAPRYVDAFTKKGGALRFLVRETDIVRDGEVVATERATLVVPVREPVS